MTVTTNKIVPKHRFFPKRPLSKREREVLFWLATGKSNKEIAALLFISTKTVETHRARIYEKLNLHDLAELTRYAMRTGKTSIGETFFPCSVTNMGVARIAVKDFNAKEAQRDQRGATGPHQD